MALRIGVAAMVVALVAVLWLGGRPRPSPPLPVADGFELPVGAPDGAGYYDAQPFGTNTHLGRTHRPSTGAGGAIGQWRAPLAR